MKTELFTAEKMPFNLISETIARPIKTLSSQDEESTRCATIRIGGYQNTPSMFDDPSYEVKINRVRECAGIICISD
jgi:hypothetical protein